MSDQSHYLEAELLEHFRSGDGLFEFLDSSLLDGIWFWDLENPENEWMSPKFWRVLGYDPAAMPHSPEAWKKIIDPHDLELAIENFDRHLKNPDHPYDQTVKYRHKNGTAVWIRCRGVALRDKNGKAIRMLGGHTDVTRQVASQEANKRLQRSNEILNAFVRSASHDLIAPTRTLEGQLNFIQQYSSENLDEDGQKLLKDGIATVLKMQTILSSLQAFSRLDRTEIEPVEIELNQFVDSMLEEFSESIAEAEVSVAVEDLGTVKSSVPMLEHVFRHLISNAILYRDPDRNLILNISRKITSSPAVIQLSDNGIGIDSEFHEMIFLPFQRLHRWNDIAGAGMGLSICEKALSKVGGSICLDSTKGEGSTFFIHLPANHHDEFSI